jgi:hypothetical protein
MLAGKALGSPGRARTERRVPARGEHLVRAVRAAGRGAVVAVGPPRRPRWPRWPSLHGKGLLGTVTAVRASRAGLVSAEGTGAAVSVAGADHCRRFLLVHPPWLPASNTEVAPGLGCPVSGQPRPGPGWPARARGRAQALRSVKAAVPCSRAPHLAPAGENRRGSSPAPSVTWSSQYLSSQAMWPAQPRDWQGGRTPACGGTPS